jgi:hypothetical protein
VGENTVFPPPHLLQSNVNLPRHSKLTEEMSENIENENNVIESNDIDQENNLTDITESTLSDQNVIIPLEQEEIDTSNVSLLVSENVENEKEREISTTENVTEVLNESNNSSEQNLTSKVFAAANSVSSIVRNVSISAVKLTGETITKVTTSASDALGKSQRGVEEGKESAETTQEEKSPIGTTTEEKELMSAKVYNAAVTASQTVVDLSLSAARYTSDALTKVATSASEAMKKESSSPIEGEAGANPEVPPQDALPVTEEDNTTVESAEPPAQSSFKAPNLWASVRRYSDTVVTLSKSMVQTQTTPQAPPQPSDDKKVAEIDSSLMAEDHSHPPDQIETVPPPKRNMWESVRRMSLTAVGAINETASTVYKAAEPVANSTAQIVGQSAQRAWTVTKEGTNVVVEKVKNVSSNMKSPTESVSSPIEEQVAEVPPQDSAPSQDETKPEALEDSADTDSPIEQSSPASVDGLPIHEETDSQPEKSQSEPVELE